MKPFNLDARQFIRQSAEELLSQNRQVDVTPNPKRASRSKPQRSESERQPPTYLTQPKIFSHYVLNLPASAIMFLDAFIGLYCGHEELFAPNTTTELPLIHVYCFSTKSDDNVREKEMICQEISERIGHEVRPESEEVDIWDVRDVAPKKRMFCASFRLPREVAFRQLDDKV